MAESVADVLREMGAYRTAFLIANPAAEGHLNAFLVRLQAAHAREVAQTHAFYACSKCQALREWVGPEEGQRQFVCSSCGEPPP